jgi:hypothetical protein
MPDENQVVKKQTQSYQGCKTTNGRKKTTRSFLGLCDFFRKHQKTALVGAPVLKPTWKDSGYKSRLLPDDALNLFLIQNIPKICHHH